MVCTGFIIESGKIIGSSSLIDLFISDVVSITTDINVIVVLGEIVMVA